MIELDNALSSVCRQVNDCYENLYPNLPKYPKFSFTRAMVTLWKAKVFSKIESNLIEAFVGILTAQRKEIIQAGIQKTELGKY